METNIAFAQPNADFPTLNFGEYHCQILPDNVKKYASLAMEDIQGVAPIAFKIPNGDSYTYCPTATTIDIIAGDDLAKTIVLLDQKDFSDLVHEIKTVSGLVRTFRVDFEKGDLDHFRRWQPTLRALFSGRPIYSAKTQQQLLDSSGEPFEFSRKFTLDDSDEVMSEYLTSVGLIHIKGVFDEQELAELRFHVDDAIFRSHPDDNKSWWSTTTDGREVVSRINYLNRFSRFFDEFGISDRIQRIGKLAGQHLRVALDRVDGPMAFVKASNVDTGLANLLWHKDCGIGGHPFMCHMVQVGVQLDHANASNGQVCFMPGSHQCSNHPVDIGEEGDLPVIKLDTEPGDVTVHDGDTFHCTPAPTSNNAGRRVLYYKFEKPEMWDYIPKGVAYNDVLFREESTGRVATRATTWKDNRQVDGY